MPPRINSRHTLTISELDINWEFLLRGRWQKGSASALLYYIYIVLFRYFAECYSDIVDIVPLMGYTIIESEG